MAAIGPEAAGWVGLFGSMPKPERLRVLKALEAGETVTCRSGGFDLTLTPSNDSATGTVSATGTGGAHSAQRELITRLTAQEVKKGEFSASDADWIIRNLRKGGHVALTDWKGVRREFKPLNVRFR